MDQALGNSFWMATKGASAIYQRDSAVASLHRRCLVISAVILRRDYDTGVATGVPAGMGGVLFTT